MAEEYQAPETQPSFLNNIRSLCGYGLVLVALACMVFSGLWMVTDFFAAASYSPNLEPATQVADFNDFAYVSETMRGYRISIGFPVLFTAIASVCLAVLLLRRNGAAKPIYVVGGIVVLSAILVLSRVFYLPIFLLLVLTFVALYLATEWHRLTAGSPLENTHQDTDSTDDEWLLASSENSIEDAPNDTPNQGDLVIEQVAQKASSDVIAEETAAAQVEDKQIPLEEKTPTLEEASIEHDEQPTPERLKEQFAAAEPEEKPVQQTTPPAEIADSGNALEPENSQPKISANTEETDTGIGSTDAVFELSEETLNSIDIELPITENVDSATVAAERVEDEPEVSLDPDDTQTNVDLSEDNYLAEPVIGPDDTHELDEALIPVISEKVSGEELADPNFNSDTEFMLESRILEPDTVTTEAPKPTAKTKTKPVKEKALQDTKAARKEVRKIHADEVRPETKKRRRKHKKASSGWKSWNLLDWIILTLIAALILGIAGLLLAG